MAKIPLGLRLEPETIASIDATRGDVSRTAWIERAIAAEMRRPAPADLTSLKLGLLEADGAGAPTAAAILRGAVERMEGSG